MNQPSEDTRRVLAVGAGGLGSPALRVLALSGVTHFTLLDDDRVDASNLQRQTLYGPEDQGKLKVECAAERIRQLSPTPEQVDVRTVAERLLPDTALEHIEGHEWVLEGADNFATKFLAADAAALSNTPIVQAGAVRWGGWAMASVPGETACMRCIFEDIPRGRPETCAVAGVVGPVVGVLGALEANLLLQLRAGAKAAGQLWSYDGLRGSLRPRRVRRRKGCPLCEGEIRDLDMSRYAAQPAA